MGFGGYLSFPSTQLTASDWQTNITAVPFRWSPSRKLDQFLQREYFESITFSGKYSNPPH